MSKITKCFNPVWRRMRYSCIHMATVGVKGLLSNNSWSILHLQCDSSIMCGVAHARDH